MELDRAALKRHIERASAGGSLNEFGVRPDLSVTAMARNRLQMVDTPGFLDEEFPEAFGLIDVDDVLRFLRTGDADTVIVQYETGGTPRLRLEDPFEFSLVTADPNEPVTTVEKKAREAILSEVESGTAAPLPEDVADRIRDGARIISEDENTVLHIDGDGAAFVFGQPETGHFTRVPYPDLFDAASFSAEVRIPLGQDELLNALDMIDNHEDAEFVVTGPEDIAAVRSEGYTHVLSPRA